MYWMLILIWVHWFADFVMQTDQQATNKSKSNVWLMRHILTYSVFLLPFGLKFALLNGAAHFATDYVSSRITSHFWKLGDRHSFFVVIGIDQALHLTVLYLTIPLIGVWSL